MPINLPENNLPICICKVLVSPGKIRYVNSLFTDLVMNKGSINNINDFIPHDWRGKHIAAMI